MSAHTFERPVDVYGSLGFTRQIGTVLQAMDFLMNWPSRRHVADYYAALDACTRALDDSGSVGQANRAFQLFAEHTGILVVGSAFAQGAVDHPVR